jgi:hypothetical protein
MFIVVYGSNKPRLFLTAGTSFPVPVNSDSVRFFFEAATSSALF